MCTTAFILPLFRVALWVGWLPTCSQPSRTPSNQPSTLSPLSAPARVLDDERLEVMAPLDAKQSLFFTLQSLVAALPKVIVQVSGVGGAAGECVECVFMLGVWAFSCVG